jgi:hypothetical protein
MPVMQGDVDDVYPASALSSLHAIAMSERYRAGIFRINDFRQNRDAIAILVRKGGAALRPCRRADIAAK